MKYPAVQTIIAAEDKKWIHVTGITKSVEKDTYENGVDPDSYQIMLQEGDQGMFESPEAMFKALNAKFGSPLNPSEWIAMDEENGRLVGQQQEDAEGMPVDINGQDPEKFKAGEVELYAATFDVYLELVSKPYQPSPDEIAQLFKVEKY